MKTMVLTGINRMEMTDIPVPEITNDTDVLVKMMSVGVCGSDIHYYTQGRIGSQVVLYPFTIGHEGSGVVEKTGSKVSRVKPGDRLAIDPAMPCFHCDQCRSGRHNTCRHLKFLGAPGQASGCLSEYIVIPETSCIHLPGHVSFEEGAIAEPLSIGLYSVKKAGDTGRKDIGILGYGPIGMSVHLSLLLHSPHHIIVTDKIDARLGKASKTGAILTINASTDDAARKVLKEKPDGLDVVFECCGQQEAVNDAIEILKPGGKLILVGIPEFDFWSLPADKMRRKEMTVINIRRQNHCAELAVELIANQQIDVSSMTTHRFEWKDAKKAFDLVTGYHDGVMKAMIHFE